MDDVIKAETEEGNKEVGASEMFEEPSAEGKSQKLQLFWPLLFMCGYLVLLVLALLKIYDVPSTTPVPIPIPAHFPTTTTAATTPITVEIDHRRMKELPMHIVLKPAYRKHELGWVSSAVKSFFGMPEEHCSILGLC
jgi:hypothetical protein